MIKFLRKGSEWFFGEPFPSVESHRLFIPLTPGVRCLGSDVQTNGPQHGQMTFVCQGTDTRRLHLAPDICAVVRGQRFTR